MRRTWAAAALLTMAFACGQSVATPSATTVPGGPYPTLDDAEAYVMSQASAGLPLQPVNPQATWRASAVLHVIHATPQPDSTDDTRIRPVSPLARWNRAQTRASSGGDFFYFFVDGDPVGMKEFTLATASAGVDATTYSITYRVYRPSDPHCCPSGGAATVRFRWAGTTLNALDPMPGPTQS